MSKLHQIALTYLKNIGPAGAKAMLTYFGTAERVFTVPPSKLMSVYGIGTKKIEQLNFDEALRRADEELNFIEKNNIDVIFYTDPKYPKRLKNCNDSPVLLYSKGNADLNTMRVISIVGTRIATDYGKQLCRQLIEELQPYNVLIVSGLALGIDVCAHKECLRLGVPTVGVLGHGLDKLYPSQNRVTAEKMLENGGLLSEYPSGTTPDRENFPQRNRIVVLPFSRYQATVQKPFGKAYPKQPRTIGEHIRKKRVESRLTQAEVGKRLAVSNDTIAMWESGKAQPKIEHYKNIIEFLGYYPFTHETDTIAGKLKQVRHCHGYTLAACGAVLGVHPTTVRNWEQSIFCCSITQRVKIMHFWSLLPAYLKTTPP